MPKSREVVADTSPLLNLALVDRLSLLQEQFDTIVVPDVVREELLAGDAGTESLQHLFEHEFVTIASIGREDLYVELTAELDAGEAAAIALAIERDADLVLIDERDGRQVARRHGLPVTGVIGILMKAARTGDIDIEAALDELREAGFWIADDLYQQAIDEVTDE